MQAERIGSQIYITSELAVSVGTIAQHHPDAAIIIEYREDDPEQCWHVTAEDGVRNVEYVCDDERGTIDPQPGQKLRLNKAQRKSLEQCVLNNGWQKLGGSAHQSMARKLARYGLVDLSETSMYITDAGREAIGS